MSEQNLKTVQDPKNLSDINEGDEVDPTFDPTAGNLPATEFPDDAGEDADDQTPEDLGKEST